MEKVLYGTRKGDPDWKERIITTHASLIPAAKAWAKANGFDRLRVMIVDDTPPDFVGAINKEVMQ